MLKTTVLVSALGLCLAIPARAESVMQKKDEVSHAQRKSLPDEVVGYTAPHRNAAGVIVGDAVGGAVVGGLVGGGVAAYRNYVNNQGWGNWQRDVLVGAGIGLGVGLIIGVADAASNADRTWTGPVADRRETGFVRPTAVYGMRF
jgi:hypothetical protein